MTNWKTGQRSLDQLFSDSVAKFPERQALYASGRCWSYRELDTRCVAIERALQSLGRIDQRRVVGLIYGRDVFTYAAVIAILRSGNIYVPLNPKLPGQRLLSILRDADISTVLVDAAEPPAGSVLELLQKAPRLQVLLSGQSDDAAAGQGTSAPLSRHQTVRVLRSDDDDVDRPRVAETSGEAELESLAYIIYTSGSTGIPKGVPVTHCSACSCIEKMHALLDTCEQDRFTQFSALSFDVSIMDLFLCWKSGACLFVPAAHEALVPLQFAARNAITVWSSVPSLANFVYKLQLLTASTLPKLRMFLFAGEALPSELALACSRAAPGARIFNLYGPTECTIFATYHQYEATIDNELGTVPIGAPLPGLTAIVVAEDENVAADDAAGELWLSGDQLASGYWNNPTATAAVFVQLSAARESGITWYRTGDLVSRVNSGALLFRGRLDRQVKLRGFRVELQEVESALRGVTGCALVAVVPVRGNGGICEKLIAYCDKIATDEADVKNRCLSRIPAYMIPDRILELDDFPLVTSGKIDYRALAARTSSAAGPP